MIPPDNVAPRELVTRKEIQQRCKVGEATVKRWDHNGVIKADMVIGGIFRYYWDKVQSDLGSRPNK
jgi:predicted site-specific integrase-resolvase